MMRWFVVKLKLLGSKKPTVTAAGGPDALRGPAASASAAGKQEPIAAQPREVET